MVEDDKADEKAEGVVKEVTKVLLDFGVLWKHIVDLLEKNFLVRKYHSHWTFPFK